MTLMTSTEASETESARKRVVVSCSTHRAQDRLAAAVGHVHVEQYDVGGPLEDHLDGGLDLVGFADDVDRSRRSRRGSRSG